MGLFDKKDHKEQLKEWKSSIRKEGYKLDRQINTIQMKSKQVEVDIRKLAKTQKYDEVKILARSLVETKKAITKLYAAKAHMNSLMLQMDEQASHLRMMGALKQSSQVMSAVNALVKLPELQATFRELSKEMTKAGIMQEMVEDVMSPLGEDSEELEQAADSEVDRILWEVTAGALGRAPAAVTDSLPAAESEQAAAKQASKQKPARVALQDGPSTSQSGGAEDEADELHARLANLRS